jgi:hypothetical protein
MARFIPAALMGCLVSLPVLAIAANAATAIAAASPPGAVCQAQSGARINPVIELYTSEGCSSCPPADQWASSLKGQSAVVQAFHVAYWDYIGWKDRFAQEAFTTRQRAIAARNGLRGIYTPQVVRNGRDWPQWRGTPPHADGAPPAMVGITLRRVGEGDAFEARVNPAAPQAAWAAYWSVTEDGHTSRVKSGENAGEFLQHDFVVRQLVPVGRYQGTHNLQFVATPAPAGHARRINLVVSDPQTGATLQALSLLCL